MANEEQVIAKIMSRDYDPGRFATTEEIEATLNLLVARYQAVNNQLALTQQTRNWWRWSAIFNFVCLVTVTLWNIFGA